MTGDLALVSQVIALVALLRKIRPGLDGWAVIASAFAAAALVTLVYVDPAGLVPFLRQSARVWLEALGAVMLADRVGLRKDPGGPTRPSMLPRPPTPSAPESSGGGWASAEGGPHLLQRLVLWLAWDPGHHGVLVLMVLLALLLSGFLSR